MTRFPKNEKRKGDKEKVKRLVRNLSLALLLLFPLVIALPTKVEAFTPNYDYILKIDRDLMRHLSNNRQNTTVDAVIVAATDLDSVRQLVASYGGTVRISLDSINALAVTVTTGSVESIAKSGSVQKVWLDHQVTLKPQADVSNMKYELLRRLMTNASEEPIDAEKYGGEPTLIDGLNPDIYRFPKDGMQDIGLGKEVNFTGVRVVDIAPQTYFTYQVGAENLWTTGYTGTGTYIAVLDDGATASHPMISSAVVGGHSEVPLEPEWNSYWAIHGTMTSSMAVGRPVIAVLPEWNSFAKAVARWFPEKIISVGTYPWGVVPPGYVGVAFIGEAPGASLWVEKVLNYNGDGEISWVLAGMQHVLNLRKTTQIHIDVVSMSLGLPMPWSAVNDGTDPWSIMVNVLATNGITIAQSAGNAGPGAFTLSQSAVAAKNIGVGGYVYARMFKTYLDSQGYESSYFAHMADDAEMVFFFASRGPTRDYRTGVAVVAPCAFTIGAGRYSDLYWGAGTSYSAPRVAGEALLLIQYYKSKTGKYPTPETVRAAIVVGADFIPGYDRIDQGGGRWNPYKASQEILKKNVVGRANNVLDANNYHDTRVTNQMSFTDGVSENTVTSLDIERYARFYFSLSDPDMYRVAITDIVETNCGMNRLFIWVFDPKGDLANIGMVWHRRDKLTSYGETIYYYAIVGETRVSGVYKWNQHWIPNDPGLWEVVVENDYISSEPVGFTIRVEKSEVTMSASADKVVLKNQGVDIGLSAKGGLKAYEGYGDSASGGVRQGQVYATTFNVRPDTKELLVTLDWDDDYFDKFPSDLDLHLIDPLGRWWISHDPPFDPMGIFGGTVNIPETDYFEDYTSNSIVSGTWTLLVAGYKVTSVSSPENFQLTIEGRTRDVSRSTATYNMAETSYIFEEPPTTPPIVVFPCPYAKYTLPFDFMFYGYTWRDVYVGANGYITFEAGYSAHYGFERLFLETPMIAAMPQDLIAAVFAVDHGTYVNFLWVGRRLGEPPEVRPLMLAQLNSDGKVVLSYMNWSGSTVAGISAGDGVNYIQISPTSGQAIQFTIDTVIPRAVVFSDANPWLPTTATVEVYYTQNTRGDYIFASRHYFIEKYFRDGGGTAITFGSFVYENSEAYH